MEQNIKNPSLIPDWFIFSGGKVAGIHDADGKEFQFVGASEKGEDGKTPILYISADDCRWYADYRDGRGPILVSQSPAASGMVGPQGETGPSGNSIVLQSAVPAEGGVQVTLAWGDSQSETSAFLIPSGAPGSSYTFDQTTTSGDGSTNPIGVNTNVIAIKDDLDEKVDKVPSGSEANGTYILTVTENGRQQEWLSVDWLDVIEGKFLAEYIYPETGLSASFNETQHDIRFGIATSGIDANKQYAWTTSGWKEVTAQGSIAAGTDLVLGDGVMKVNTNGTANVAGMAFVEGVDTAASGAGSHAEGKETSAFGDYSHVEGFKNTEQKINGLNQANHVEGSYNNLKGVYSHLEGNANALSGYGVHMEGAYNIFAIKNTSADKSDPLGRWNIWGQSIEGMACATSAEPISGYDGNTPLYYHGGILKVIGNGTRTKTDESDPSSEIITRSDALILYRDGSMWVQGPISANGQELGNYTPSLSLNIGTGNTVIDDGKCAVIGNRSTVSGNSFVVCDDNSACDNSFAFGWKVKAKLYSFAGGHGNPGTADADAIAENYSVALGDACEAYNYSQAFGRGVKITGDANGKGALAVGGWNKTQSNALFVVGNGTGNGNARSDAMVVGLDGGVSATRFANKNGTDTVGAYSGINNVQVYPAGTSTSNFPDDGVLRIVLES